jgi:hypothetical protein
MFIISSKPTSNNSPIIEGLPANFFVLTVWIILFYPAFQYMDEFEYLSRILISSLITLLAWLIILSFIYITKINNLNEYYSN